MFLIPDSLSNYFGKINFNEYPNMAWVNLHCYIQTPSCGSRLYDSAIENMSKKEIETKYISKILPYSLYPNSELIKKKGQT